LASPNHEAGEYLNKMNRVFKYSRGQVLVMYAGIVAILVGATALSADVAVMYMNSIQVQKAVDTAAVVGANYLSAFTFPTTSAASGCGSKPDSAQMAACSYAANNGLAVDSTNLVITEPTSSTIKVEAHRTGLPYYFGKVIGLNTYDVSATATATASQAVKTVKNGMFPVGLQCTNPCSLSSMDPGQSVSFGAKFVNGLAPGNWQWLALNSNGDSALGTNIQNGATGTYSIGDSLTSEPGNNANSQNIRTGLSNRFASCPSIADPCSAGGPNPSNIPVGDPCLVIIPAVDYHGCNGSCTGLKIEGFALIYLESTSSASQINGCFVQAVTANTISSAGATQLGADVPPSLIQ
jgi:hypothetical protein